MTSLQRTYSPIDGSLYAERELFSLDSLKQAVDQARLAQRQYKKTPLRERCRIARAFAAYMLKNQEQFGKELTWQMGRPISQSPGELVGTHERATALADLAEEALAGVVLPPKSGFRRWISREPLGVVLVLAPWNYPYLTAVNSVVAALLAGNAVLLKHSEQTPLCAERFAEALEAAGLPSNVFQVIHAEHAAISTLISSGGIDYVAFTGSVEGGNAVARAAASRRLGVGLELGGKDAAYVRGDSELSQSVESLVDGAFFNSGQSCCGVERIYVAESKFDSFVESYVAETRKYRLGNPLESSTTLGPLVRASSAQHVRGQVQEAISQGAMSWIEPSEFPADRAGTAYLAPQVLTNVSSSMRVMSEESFGPVVGISSVGSDEEAVSLINDCDYGLTASIWTQDENRAQAIAEELEVGTVFMNRCDYLDPELAWTGVKNSGRGCTLSRYGIESFTRPKSFHFRTGS